MTTVERARSGVMIFLLPVFCASCIYGFMRLNSLIPEFYETLSASGRDLPFITLLFLQFHIAIFSSLSALSVGALIATYLPYFSSKVQSAAFYYSLASPAVFGLFLLLVLVAMYLPVFTTE